MPCATIACLSPLRRAFPGQRPCHPSRTGMSLLEIMVVIAIIVALTGMLMVGIKIISDSARKSYCQSNLRQLGMGLMGYSSEWESQYPNWKWQDAINDYINEGRQVGWNAAANDAYGKSYSVGIARCKEAPAEERGVTLGVTYGMTGTTYGTYKGFVESDLSGSATNALNYRVSTSQVVNPTQKAILMESWSWTSNQQHWGSNHVNNRNVRVMHRKQPNILWADFHIAHIRVDGEPNTTVNLGADPMWEPATTGSSAYAQ